jgi:uncharacterized protein
MSPPGRPKGEHRSAQREGSPVSPPGRPKGEHRSAQREGSPVSAAGPSQGARPLGGAARSAVRGEPATAGPSQGARPLGGAARSAVRGEYPSLTVTVAYAAPGVEAVLTLAIAAGATVADAVAASGLVERLALPPAATGFAIHGQRADADTPVADGDRIELTRPLRADPKQARRARAAQKPLPTPAPRRRKGLSATS